MIELRLAEIRQGLAWRDTLGLDRRPTAGDAPPSA
jgi:hypothetical protein